MWAYKRRAPCAFAQFRSQSTAQFTLRITSQFYVVVNIAVYIRKDVELSRYLALSLLALLCNDIRLSECLNNKRFLHILALS